MIKGKYYLIILGIIIVATILLRISSFFGDRSVKNSESIEQPASFILEGQPTSTELVSTSTIETAITTKEVKPEINSEVIINFPQANEMISSPVVVSGQARGGWFFEASLPVKLIDEQGNILATVPAIAEADWMTSDFVPFKALVEFSSTSSSGYLVISKDNPSGLIANDASISIPVRFLTK